MIRQPTPILPNNLRRGRRALDDLKDVVILQDWWWSADYGEWILSCRFSPVVLADGPIPITTDWFITASQFYPSGKINIFPSKHNGINQTYQHQRDNRSGEDRFPWRTGNICQSENIQILGRFTDSQEPLDADNRLRWNILRALSWINAASEGMLALTGDPFELPDFATSDNLNFAFLENWASLALWQHNTEIVGTVDLVSVNERIQVITRFKNQHEKIILEASWGKRLRNIHTLAPKGIWIKLDFIPVIKPWQAPHFLSELSELMKSHGLDFFDLLKGVWPKIRDSKRHPLFLGFPIPAQHGSLPARMHWQGFLLPKLTYDPKSLLGFRKGEKGFTYWDKQSILIPKMPLDWKASENWAQDQISTRGRLPSKLTGQKTLLIGCGALGSCIAEMLVRGGMSQLTIIDNDGFNAGNLVRHTLLIDDIKISKVNGLADRLNSLSPFADVTPILDEFPPNSENATTICQENELIIDCTGSDLVLSALDEFPWASQKHFVSLSFNYAARDLFCFSAVGKRFPTSEFRQVLKPFLIADAQENDLDQLPQEGIGCWHPVFPARADDIWLVASIAIKYIEKVVTQSQFENSSNLMVFRKEEENGFFKEIRELEQD